MYGVSSNKFIHYEGSCSPCALCSAKANKYTPSKYNRKQNFIHTQTSSELRMFLRQSCIQRDRLIFRHLLPQRDLTKKRGNNRRVGSLSKTQVKALFTNKSKITSTKVLVHGQNILTVTMPDYQVLQCHQLSFASNEEWYAHIHQATEVQEQLPFAVFQHISDTVNNAVHVNIKAKSGPPCYCSMKSVDGLRVNMHKYGSKYCTKFRESRQMKQPLLF